MIAILQAIGFIAFIIALILIGAWVGGLTNKRPPQ